MSARRLVAACAPNTEMCVRFSGPRLLDGNGDVLAELAADGSWNTSDGKVAHGLTETLVRDADTIEQDDAWLREAGELIISLAEAQQYLTSDDVWALVEGRPSESRMMGNAFSRAQMGRVIARTDEHQPSTRRENHGRPILIWRSLRHGQQRL